MSNFITFSNLFWILFAFFFLKAGWDAWFKEKKTLRESANVAKELRLEFYPAFNMHSFAGNMGQKIGLKAPTKEVWELLNTAIKFPFYWPYDSKLEYIFCRIVGERHQIFCEHYKRPRTSARPVIIKETLFVLEKQHFSKSPIGLTLDYEGALHHPMLNQSITDIKLAGFNIFLRENILVAIIPEKQIEPRKAIEYFENLEHLSKQLVAIEG